MTDAETPEQPPEKNKGGRPLKFKTVDELQVAVDSYFDMCDPYIEERMVESGINERGEIIFARRRVMTEQKPYTVSGLARALGISRQALLDYGDREEFLDKVEAGKERCHEYAENQLFGKSASGASFSLKNNWGWKERQEIDHTTDGKPMQALVEIVRSGDQVGIKFLEEFEELFNEAWRNIVFYGGRGSGKSQHVALALILRGRQKKLRILATREIQKTVADSVHKLLKDIIDKYGFTDYEVTDKTIRNTITCTEFIFSGLRHNVNEIKSMEGIDIAWVEEAQSISEDSLKVLAPTFRKDGSQIIFTFNRLNELDPVYVRYVMNAAAKTFSKKVNFDGLDDVDLLPDALKPELEADRLNPNTFAHVWLGEPVSQADNAIIGRDAILAAMKREVESDGALEIGADIARMGNDRTVFMKRKGLKLIDTKSFTKLRTTEVCDQLEDFADFDKTIMIKIDDTGVGGGVTDEMIKRGYLVVPVNFGAKADDANLLAEATPLQSGREEPGRAISPASPR